MAQENKQLHTENDQLKLLVKIKDKIISELNKKIHEVKAHMTIIKQGQNMITEIDELFQVAKHHQDEKKTECYDNYTLFKQKQQIKNNEIQFGNKRKYANEEEVRKAINDIEIWFK